MIANQEFTSLQHDYRFIRFLGVEVVVNPCQVFTNLGAPQLIYVPPVFLTIQVGYGGSLNAANVARSDSAVEVPLVNTGGVPTKLKASFPSVMMGVNG